MAAFHIQNFFTILLFINAILLGIYYAVSFAERVRDNKLLMEV